MKRIKVKFEQIADIENIKSAIVNAARNKKHRRSITKCLNDIDGTAIKIQRILLSPDRSKYLSTGTVKVINEGTGRKVRTICRPNFFPDQIIHWAVMQKLAPYFVKMYYTHSYASVPGKGVHKALRKMNSAFRRDMKGTKYCLQFDIRHAYDSVNKELIVACVRRKVKDPRVTDLKSDIVYSYVLSGLPKGF
ncbi:MAG: hypothetical protein LUD27_00695 [Clostridia bacterium]|nr:hypothetical protein [Clostridia bacterium]